MKSWFPASLAVFACTSLTTVCCRLSGMPRHDLWIAAIVAFSVSGGAAFTTTALSGARTQRRDFK